MPASTPTPVGTYLTLEELKRQLNIAITDTSDDVYITELGVAAESALAAYLERPLSDVATSAALPAGLQHALRMTVATFYANRESVTFGSPMAMPLAYAHLVNPYVKPRSYADDNPVVSSE